MAVPTVADLRTLVLERLQANVAVDAPVTPAEVLRQLNDAYADLWDISGTSVTKATHATLWVAALGSPGDVLLVGKVANLKELLRVFISVTSGSVGMEAQPDPGAANYTAELDRMEMAELVYRRSRTQLYAQTSHFAVERPEAAAAADVGKVNLHLWPAIGAVGFRYFPAHYVKTKTDLVADADVPDLTELEARDIALLAAARLAPLANRAEFVPQLLADISERTQNALEAKLRALMEPKRRPQETTA